MELISFDIVSEMAFFKKNDANNILQISYNFIHKPAVLGILGAIMGFKGYGSNKKSKNTLPQYYQKLGRLKIGITPHYKKPLKKFVSHFNNSTGLASSGNYKVKKKNSRIGQTWQIKEQIMIGNPFIKFTIWILNKGEVEDALFQELKKRLKGGKSTFPIYCGKNEFFAWFENFRCNFYLREIFNSNLTKVSSLMPVHRVKVGNDCDFFDIHEWNIDDETNEIYEYLPYDFDEDGFYLKSLFLFTNKNVTILNNDNFFEVYTNDDKKIATIFFI